MNLATAVLRLVVDNSQGLAPGIYSRDDKNDWTLIAERVMGAWYYRTFNHITGKLDYEPYLDNDQQLLDKVKPGGMQDVTR